MIKVQHTFDGDIYCPFFKGTEASQVIRCESPIPETVLRLGFTGKKKCAEYRETYCSSKDCERCQIHRCLMAKYEEEP